MIDRIDSNRGKNLNSYRQYIGVNKAELRARSGLDRETITRLEHGGGRDKSFIIASCYLGINPSALIEADPNQVEIWLPNRAPDDLRKLILDPKSLTEEDIKKVHDSFNPPSPLSLYIRSLPYQGVTPNRVVNGSFAMHPRRKYG